LVSLFRLLYIAFIFYRSNYLPNNNNDKMAAINFMPDNEQNIKKETIPEG